MGRGDVPQSHKLSMKMFHRQAEGQTGRGTERQRDRQAEGQIGRGTDRQRDRQTR